MNQMIVADKMRKMLDAKGRVNKAIDYAQKVRGDMYITRAYFDEVNSRTDQNGVFFVENEEKTKELNEQAAAMWEERKKKDEAKKLSARAALSAIIGEAATPEERRKPGRPKRENLI